METAQKTPGTIFTGSAKPLAKKLVITFAAVAAIIGLFMLPPYRDWLHDRIIAYYGEFAVQKNKMAIEQRLAYRFAGSYTYSKQIAVFLGKKNNKATALVLVPPTDYFKEYGIYYTVPEPAVFYYYTGVKTLWPNSSNAAKANWYAHVNNGKIVVDSITNHKAFTDTLANLNKFNIAL